MAMVRGKRELIARALGKSLLRPVSRALGQPGLLALTYHRVCDYDTLDDGVVSASVGEFEWQLSFLRETIRVLSGDEIVRYVRGELQLREPALCITFDDGYADNLEAGRILSRAGLSAIFFVTTGFVGTDTITHWDRISFAVKRTEETKLSLPGLGGKGPWSVEVAPRDLASRELRNIYLTLPKAVQELFVSSIEKVAGAAAKDAERAHPPFMRWDDVRQLKALGHTIGAHTHSHPILAQVPLEEQERELRTSRDVLGRELGQVTQLLAYPNGKSWSFSAQTKELAQRVGFEAAFSFYGGRNPAEGFDPYDLRRVWVSPTESRDLFRARISFPQLLA